MEFRAAEIATVVDGTLTGDDVGVDGVSIDSREIEAGQLFVPIVAARDGHDFISAALDRGVPAYLSSRRSDTEESRAASSKAISGGGAVIEVADTAVALTALGSAARDRLNGAVVGVTGSVGKTTTKDLTASVLRRRFITHANLRSFNNELGVPLTLANAPEGTEATVIEMGARGTGHIADLCAIARPTIGVVTTVEQVHTELFGSVEQVAVAKRELIEALPVDGTAVLFADNRSVMAMADFAPGRVVTFGLGADADVRAIDVEVDDQLRPRFRLGTVAGSAAVTLSARGAHNVTNALAAAAVGLVVGVPLDEIARGLGEESQSPWRMDLRVAPSGARVLNDAYNAGPASMRAALDALVLVPADRRVAVLGVMAELGDDADRAHRAIAARAEDLGIELIVVGTDSYGVEPVGDIDDVIDRLGSLGAADAVLVKGSRVAGLERVAHVLLEID